MKRHTAATTLLSASILILILLPQLNAAELADRKIDFSDVTQYTGQSDTLVRRSSGLTIAADSVVGVYESRAIAAPIPFTAVGPHWRAKMPAGTGLQLELSTSADGQKWSPYHIVDADPHLQPVEYFPDGQLNPYYGETLGGLTHRSRGDGLYIRYRLTLKRDSSSQASPVISNLTFTFIDSSRPGVNAETADDDRGASTELRGGAYPKPPVNSRVAWGADPPTCSYSYCSVTHIATHHTAGVSEYSCNGFSDCAADVRAVQSYHMNVNGWCDIGYNYLASADGALWEGRGGGDDVRAAHDGYNCGSMGVSNMGYYHPPFNHVWTEAQLDAFAELAAWKADQKGIDPFGAGFYTGLGATMDNIYGHRDVSSTACPGDNIYPRLAELRSRVSDKLNGSGGATLILDNPSVGLLLGNWTTGTSSTDKYGSNYYFASTSPGNLSACIWPAPLSSSGNYDISFWWPQGSNRNPATKLFIMQNGVFDIYTVNQQINGGQWNAVASKFLTSGPVFLGVLNVGATGSVVICDAVRVTGPN